MNHFRLLAAAALLPALAACGYFGGSSTPAALTASPVATVNGTPIGQDFFAFYVKGITNGKTPADLTPEQRGQALDNLVRAELLAQQAQKEGLDKNTDTASLIELSRLNLLQRALTDKEVPKPTEEEMRAEYENAVATYPKTEYHARHILVATEAFAQQIIDRLNKGEKFEDLARTESMDTSKSNGGDIGWFTLNSMDQAFGDAVANLKPGGYTHTPVQTQYGWHVIQLIETRDTTPPSYDRARDRIAQVIEARHIKAYTDQLLRTAKVDRKYPLPKASAPAAAASTSAASDKKS